MSKSIIYFFVAFCSSLQIVEGQTRKIDSLVSVLKTLKEDTVKVNLLNDLSKGVLYLKPENSKIYADDALALSHKLQFPKGKGRAMGNLGNYYYSIGDYDKALDLHLRSVPIKEKINDELGLASAETGIGNVYLRQKNYQEALIHYQKSLGLCKNINFSPGISACLNSIGLSYYYLNNNEQAKKNLLEALDISERTGNAGSEASSINNLGNVFYSMQDYNEAIKYYERSLKIKLKSGDNDGIASSYINLGVSYGGLKKYKQSIDYLGKGLESARLSNSKEWIQNAYYNLANIYQRMGQYEPAYENYKRYHLISDSLINKEKVRSLNEMQTKYQSEKKEKEIQLLQKDKEKQAELSELDHKRKNIIIFSIVTGLLLLLTFSLFIFNRFKVTQKQKYIIEKQKELVDDKQKEILDSIHYAERIQHALLASDTLLNANLNGTDNNFVLFRPKDIVSGDFYWATEYNEKFYLAVCDSTGHGVPGAFMSLLSMGFLSEAIKEKGILLPNEILNYVRIRLIDSISSDGQKDGFDGILLCIDKKNNSFTYSAAYNCPVLISKGQITSLDCDKMPVGKGERTASFTTHAVTVTPGDHIYLYTDGFADQFGGPKGKKFKYKQLHDKLIQLSILDPKNQKQELKKVFENWKGGLEQVDDVLLIGVKI